MNDDEKENRILQLEEQVNDLKTKYESLLSSSGISVELEEALIKRGFVNVNEKEIILYSEGGVGGNTFTNRYRLTRFRNKSDYTQYINGIRQFTVTLASDLINVPNHGYKDGQYLQFQTTDTLPAGLDSLIDSYVVINATANTFQASVDGVDPVDITDIGVGEHYVNTF